MIVHLFIMEREHLDPRIAHNFYEGIKKPQKFIFFSNNSKDREYKILERYEGMNYKYIRNYKTLFQYLKSLPSNCRVFAHGMSYGVLFLLSFMSNIKTYWIIWGSGCTINKSFLSCISAPIKRILYNRLYCIITLMEEDKESMINEIKTSTKCITIPYFATDKRQVFPYSLNDILSPKPNKSITVYLGNNPSSIDSYFKMIDLLSRFSSADLSVRCMMNYSYVPNEKTELLYSIGRNVFAEKFKFETAFYPIEEYFQYMNQCDIYICGVEKQTGLGALNTTLKLGKKVFLTGKNYTWARKRKAKIYHIDEINQMSLEEFIKPLSIEEKKNNYNIILQRELKNSSSEWAKLME